MTSVFKSKKDFFPLLPTTTEEKKAQNNCSYRMLLVWQLSIFFCKSADIHQNLIVGWFLYSYKTVFLPLSI